MSRAHDAPSGEGSVSETVFAGPSSERIALCVGCPHEQGDLGRQPVATDPACAEELVRRRRAIGAWMGLRPTEELIGRLTAQREAWPSGATLVGFRRLSHKTCPIGMRGSQCLRHGEKFVQASNRKVWDGFRGRGALPVEPDSGPTCGLGSGDVIGQRVADHDSRFPGQQV